MSKSAARVPNPVPRHCVPISPHAADSSRNCPRGSCRQSVFVSLVRCVTYRSNSPSLFRSPSRHPHPGERLTHYGQRHPVRSGLLGEGAVALVDPQVVRLAVVGHEHVRPPVPVAVEDRDPQSRPGRSPIRDFTVTSSNAIRGLFGSELLASSAPRLRNSLLAVPWNTFGVQ